MSKLEIIYRQFCSKYSLTTDSRKVLAGSIYVALRGERFDGNKFAKQALESGAALVVIDNPEYLIDNERVVFVDDSLKLLQALATHHRQVLNVPVIALTGSNGKTTTKELLYESLSTRYNVLATPGNFNNHIGVPLTILEARPDHDLMIVEMGANHVGEIRDLCKIALPDVGLVTNIGKAHLEGFGGYEGVIKAKSEMYQFLKSTGGTIIFNVDDELLLKIVGDYLPRVHYTPQSDFELVQAYPNLCFIYKGENYTSNLVGGYNISNIATAMSVGKLMKCDEVEMLKAITKYMPSNNRSQKIEVNGIHFILDAYNANPTSMKLAIEGFGASSYINKIMILGDMLELGEDSAKEHKAIIIQCLNLQEIDVIFVGPLFKYFEKEYSSLIFVDSIHELQSYIKGIQPSSHCLVKGSRRLQLEKIIDYLD